MSVHFIFTIDGDWDEYFDLHLPKSERQPDKSQMLRLILHEKRIASLVNGKFIHFVHSSPTTPYFFLEKEFVELWKEIISGGGGIGVHCHNEDLYSKGRLSDKESMAKSVANLTGMLAAEGFAPISYRGGYLTFCEQNIPILEQNGLVLDFSCESNRFLRHDGRVIANWLGAPENHYQMCYQDHRKEGESGVVEIPLGKAGGGSLYIDITSLRGIWKAARALAKKDKETPKDIIVSVLSHTYEFASFWKRMKIALALIICRLYGRFINDKEALDIICKNGKG